MKGGGVLRSYGCWRLIVCVLREVLGPIVDRLVSCGNRMSSNGFDAEIRVTYIRRMEIEVFTGEMSE